MTIQRITEKFNLDESGRFVIVFGNTSDRFILPNLRLVNLDELLFSYLKNLGYMRIVFINPEAVGGIYTYDQHSLELLSLKPANTTQNEQNRMQVLEDIGFKEDTHWEQQTTINPKQGKSNSTSIPRINSERDSRGRYFAKISGGNSVMEILDILAKSGDEAKSAYIFNQFNQFFNHVHEKNASHMQRLSQLLYEWSLLNTKADSKYIFVFINEYSEKNIHDYLSQWGINSIMSVFSPGKTEIEENDKIKLVNPKSDEIHNLLHRYRILSSMSLEWENINKIIDRIEARDFTLAELIKKVENLNQLSYGELIERKIITPLEIEVNKETLTEALKEIRGQDDNLSVIVNQLIYWAKKTKKEAPLNFFMVGASGVGKTFTAKKIAEVLKPWGFEYLYFDMTKFADQHAKTILFGAPPSYVGYGETPRLLKAIDETSRLVIIFDEIEKAHKDIFTSLMQLLDEGIVQFGDGTQKNFSECIIFFTSNLEREKVVEIKARYLKQNEQHKISDQAFQNQLRTIIEQSKKIPAEVTGRIQNLLVYNTIKGRDLIEIALQNLLSMANEEGINLVDIDAKILAEIALRCENSTKGMRELKRELQDIFVYRDS